jgi:hypothetical protein
MSVHGWTEFAPLPFVLGLMLMAISRFLTTFDRRSENVAVEAIIVRELELRNVKMQVFPANIVECADDTAPENAQDC